MAINGNIKYGVEFIKRNFKRKWIFYFSSSQKRTHLYRKTWIFLLLRCVWDLKFDKKKKKKLWFILVKWHIQRIGQTSRKWCAQSLDRVSNRIIHNDLNIRFQSEITPIRYRRKIPTTLYDIRILKSVCCLSSQTIPDHPP